jgi:hypothetical protein
MRDERGGTKVEMVTIEQDGNGPDIDFFYKTLGMLLLLCCLRE